MSSFASGYIKYINHLEQINDTALSDPLKMIKEVEQSFFENLEVIASNIIKHKHNIKIVMLAGPSSSGKTTTAKLLSEFLIKQNKNAYIISLDDYYLNHSELVRGANGEIDLETIKALDVEGISECLKTICDNGYIEVPKYDFPSESRIGHSLKVEVKENDIFIVEGIHALNPVFTKDINSDNLVKLYVSVKQSIKDANGEVIEPMDLRLLRRIVRDIQFRDTAPEETLGMWKSVVKGEDKYIRPYRLSADYTVNSTLIYEPCVIRKLAIPILRRILEDSPYYRKARALEAKLMRFEPISTDLVPETSILREFIGFGVTAL